VHAALLGHVNDVG